MIVDLLEALLDSEVLLGVDVQNVGRDADPVDLDDFPVGSDGREVLLEFQKVVFAVQIDSPPQSLEVVLEFEYSSLDFAGLLADDFDRVIGGDIDQVFDLLVEFLGVAISFFIVLLDASSWARVHVSQTFLVLDKVSVESFLIIFYVFEFLVEILFLSLELLELVFHFRLFSLDLAVFFNQLVLLE